MSRLWELYTQKAMMGCGMALNLNEVWEDLQLFQNMQRIVCLHRENFEGKAVLDSLGVYRGAKVNQEEDVKPRRQHR